MIGLVHVPYLWHATLLEILWLIGGLFALPLGYANLRDAAKDEEILSDVRSDPAIHSRHYFMIEQAAKGQTMDHWLTVGSSAMIVLAGVIGCLVPNPIGGATTATGLAVTGALLGISAITAVRAFAAMLRRNRMYELAAGRSSVIAAELRARNAPSNE